MASYNEVDGVPSHANRWLLRDVLRDEWGFGGFVVSDYYAIWELSDRPETHGHHVAHDKREACVLAVRAGVNIELPEPDCYLHLTELVRDGTLAERELDELVAPMLRAKFALGLFDDPYVDPRRGGPRRRQRRASPTGAASRARNDHAAQERRRPAAARPSVVEHDRRHRPERESQPARRLQRRPEARRHRAAGHPRPRRRPRAGALQRRLQDHARRFVERGRSRRQRPRRGSQADRRGGARSPRRRT